MRDMVWIILAVIGWGTWGLFEKLAVRNMSPMLVQLCNAYIYSAFAPMMYLGMKAQGTSFNWNSWGILWTLLASLGATLAGYSFLFAIQNKPVNEVMAWTQVYPILTFALCWAVLGEAFTWSKALGGALIIAGALVMNR